MPTDDFPLLPRYPARRTFDGVRETGYVLREHLTLKERFRNIERLRRRQRHAHANALEAETFRLMSSGQLREP